MGIDGQVRHGGTTSARLPARRRRAAGADCGGALLLGQLLGAAHACQRDCVAAFATEQLSAEGGDGDARHRCMPRLELPAPPAPAPAHGDNCDSGVEAWGLLACWGGMSWSLRINNCHDPRLSCCLSALCRCNPTPCANMV